MNYLQVFVLIHLAQETQQDKNGLEIFTGIFMPDW